MLTKNCVTQTRMWLKWGWLYRGYYTCQKLYYNAWTDSTHVCQIIN
jgi:hypothetical protein